MPLIEIIRDTKDETYGGRFQVLQRKLEVKRGNRKNEFLIHEETIGRDYQGICSRYPYEARVILSEGEMEEITSRAEDDRIADYASHLIESSEIPYTVKIIIVEEVVKASKEPA